jgi:hypothetical protein
MNWALHPESNEQSGQFRNSFGLEQLQAQSCALSNVSFTLGLSAIIPAALYAAGRQQNHSLIHDPIVKSCGGPIVNAKHGEERQHLR